MLHWDGVPVEFYKNVSYGCLSSDIYFEMDKDLQYWNMTCLPDGTWNKPAVWPVCLASKKV